jgi:hypothetical protein
MRRIFLFVAVALLTLNAQRLPPETATAPSRFNVLLNPFLGPVSGAPVTATFAINVKWWRVGGDIETLDSTFQVARDSRGRISHELRRLVPASSTGAPQLVGVVLYDPRTKTSQTIDQATRTDVELQSELPADTLSASNLATLSRIAEIEELGEKTNSGLEVKGVRCTWKAQNQASLTGQASQTSIESWYSNDLHMIVSERRVIPLQGVVSITLSEIDRHEPPAGLCTAPQGYQVIRLKRQVLTRQVRPGLAQDGSWSITPPDYDPNDGSGGFSYPFPTR